MSWANIATQVTLCNFGTTGAAFAASAAWASAYTGQIWGTVGFGAASAALAAASAASGCYFPPPDPPGGAGEGICGCRKSSAVRRVTIGGGDNAIGSQAGVELIRLEKNVNGNTDSWYLHYIKGPGQEPVREYFFTNTSWDNPDFCVGLEADGPGECLADAGEPDPPQEPDPVPIIDPDTGCEWSVTMSDAYLNERGALVVQYRASSNDPSVCGPDQYWWDEAGKAPTPTAPAPDGGPPPPPTPLPSPCPDPCPDIPAPTPPPTLPGTTYVLRGICEDVQEGEQQPEFEYQTAGGPYYAELAQRIDHLANMLQTHLALKTPVCNEQTVAKQGEYRTISFISDEQSPNGRDRLRKRLRYRSVSGVGLTELVDHWRSFTWQAGPVCVSHKGAYWGAPQVWAATAEEGKRVIRHAAVEAGLDPDQVGRWLVSGSDNPRYGVPGTMRVNTSGGYYWITDRLESNNRPQVEQI